MSPYMSYTCDVFYHINSISNLYIVLIDHRITVFIIFKKLVKLLNGVYIKYHCYADDTQISLYPCDKCYISFCFGCCIEGRIIWMNSNMLKLNKDKTEFLVFYLIVSVGSSYKISSMSVGSLGC